MEVRSGVVLPLCYSHSHSTSCLGEAEEGYRHLIYFIVICSDEILNTHLKG